MSSLYDTSRRGTWKSRTKISDDSGKLNYFIVYNGQGTYSDIDQTKF